MENKLNVLDYLIKDTNNEIEYINYFKIRKEEVEKESDEKKIDSYFMNG